MKLILFCHKLKAANESSTLQSGAQRVGGRWKPDAGAEAEWTRELQAERHRKVVRVGFDGEGTVIEAQGIEPI